MNSTGGDFVGHNGEKFAIVFSRLCRVLMRLGELTEKTSNDTSLAEGENVSVAPALNLDSVERNDHRNVCVDQAPACESETVCVAPARVLDSEERSVHERGGHVRKAGNCFPCAAACGRLRSHFRLDPTTRPGGCLSVDTSGPRVPGIWQAHDDSQFVVTRKAR